MAPGSIFEAPGLDFGASGGDFSKFLTVCGFVSSKWSLHIQNARMPRKPRTPRTPKKSKTRTRSQVGKPTKGWVGGGDPPPGVFNNVGGMVGGTVEGMLGFLFGWKRKQYWTS